MLVTGIALIAVALLCAIFLVYPYAIYPVLLRRVPTEPPPAARDQPDSAGQVAILFSAYNEEASAGAKVKNLQSLLARHPTLEIRIFDDGSTDATRELFAQLGPDVVISSVDRVGKASGMARLVATTNRRILLFTDANVILAEDIVDRAASYFVDGTIGGICGHLEYEGTEGTATQAAGGAYWRLEERIKHLESQSGSVMGGDGSIFAMRRELYPSVPPTAQDDFRATMAVIFAGMRLVIADDVIVTERLVADSRDEYRRKVRIAARAMHTHLSMRPQLRMMTSINRWKYNSHKVLRWYGAFFLAVGALAGLSGLALIDPNAGVVSLLATATIGAAILWWPKLGKAREILLAIVATGHGVVLGLAGRTFATWTPPKSR